MTPERSQPEPTHTALQARATRARERVRTRVVRVRMGIIAGIAATTCGLAVFIQSIAPGSSAASAHTSASAAPGSVQQLFGGGGPGDHADAAAGAGGSAPSATSGQGDAVSGGS
jgi:hypothetical protein